MTKRDFESLDKQLRELQILLAKPGKKIVGVLSYYLNFLNPLSKIIKNNGEDEGDGHTKTQSYHNIKWIDIENPNRKEINKLAEEYPFHPLHLESSLIKGQLPQIEKEDKYLFLILQIPVFNQLENKIVNKQVCIFLGKNYLVTIHDDTFGAIRELFNLCEDDSERRGAYFKKSSGYLLYNVIDSMVSDLSGMIQAILHEMDEIEDLVFDVKVSVTYQVGELRQKIIKLRRVLGYFKKILEELEENVDRFTGDDLSRYYENITKMINRLRETIEEARETVEVYKDADFTVSTEKTNKILAVLTIIFTLSIPATLVGTFYGMNVILPGGIEDGPWTFLGPYSTLIVIFALAIIPIILMLLYFKYKDWF